MPPDRVIERFLDQIAGPEVGQRFSNAFPNLALAERITMLRREIDGRVVFTTSFGIEDQAIADAVFTQNLEIDVVSFDTGRLFPETYELWARTEDRYRTRIKALYPDRESLEVLVGRQGINGFRSSFEARYVCCGVRKVEPLQRALAGAVAWITGMRADQSPDRASAEFAAIDDYHQVLKVNPLLDWTRDRVVRHARDHGIPINTLHDRRFLSVGCAPCTRAVAPHEPERAGRWWWEQDEKKECGLHPEYFARARKRISAQPVSRGGSMP